MRPFPGRAAEGRAQALAKSSVSHSARTRVSKTQTQPHALEPGRVEATSAGVRMRAAHAAHLHPSCARAVARTGPPSESAGCVPCGAACAWAVWLASLKALGTLSVHTASNAVQGRMGKTIAETRGPPATCTDRAQAPSHAKGTPVAPLATGNRRPVCPQQPSPEAAIATRYDSTTVHSTGQQATCKMDVNALCFSLPQRSSTCGLALQQGPAAARQV